jgi:uncharacterized protein
MRTPLREKLGEFIAALRAAGIRISVAESMDAMNAVAAAGLDRSRMCEALASTLIKDEADRTAFDAEFARFFAAPDRGDSREHRERPSRGEPSAASGTGGAAEAPLAHAAKRVREPRAPQERAEKPHERDDDPVNHDAEARQRSEPSAEHRGERERARDGESRNEGAAAEPGPGLDAARLARLRILERIPFEKYSDLEYREARAALEPLKRRFRIRLGRRLRIAAVGRLDFRRTIRAAMQRGGTLIDLRFRARRPRHVDLVILADVSGSVHYAAELLLDLMAGTRECFSRVRSFVYVDRLAEAEFEQGHMVMTPALDLYARSDFGRVLGELWERRDEILNRRTLVVIMGDARNNRRPPRAPLLGEIARITRGVVWLNPEDPARWGTGDSAMRLYEREVSLLLQSRNLHELERALLSVA